MSSSFPRPAAVRRLREDAGLSQEALAERAGVTIKTIGRLEAHGIPSHMQIGTLERLRAALGAPSWDALTERRRPPRRLSAAATAQALGISDRTLRRRLTTRPRSVPRPIARRPRLVFDLDEVARFTAQHDGVGVARARIEETVREMVERYWRIHDGAR